MTTLREDVVTDGRHAHVRWSSEGWRMPPVRFYNQCSIRDARRGQGDYFDGLDDLARAGYFVGRASDRIPEDWLRILSSLIYARYGRTDPIRMFISMPKICRTLAAVIRRASATKIFNFPHVLRPSLMRGARVLEYTLPEAHAFGLRQLIFLETRGLVMEGVGPDPWRRLASVLQVNAITIRHIAQRLKLSNAQVSV